MNELQREALKAALRLPYPCFPCDEQKRPTVRGGFKSARTVDSGLSSLWLRHPGELIGVPTGTASGFSVLDVDLGKGGDAWWNANKGRLPGTRQHETRSGGAHVLFKHREGIRNTAGRIAPGIDTRGEGGYVIWWPVKGFGVINPDALAPWPDWLKPPDPPPPYPKAASRAALPAIEGLVRAVATAAPGQRNSLTYWAAHRMRESVAEGKITEGLARDILLEAAGRAGLPPREASLTINSAMRGGRG